MGILQDTLNTVSSQVKQLARPNHAKATPPKEPTKHIPFTDEEFSEYLIKMEAYGKETPEREKMEKEKEMKAELNQQVYSKMGEAQYKQMFENDDSMLRELNLKRDEIIKKYR